MKKIFLVLVLTATSLYSQNKKIDSLKKELLQATGINDKVIVNLQLAKLYERVDLIAGKAHAQQAVFYRGNDSLLAEANSQLARFYFFSGKLDSAVFHFEKAKRILRLLKNENGVAEINISIGAVQLRQGDYNNTIKTLTNSAIFFENHKDDLNAAKCYSNIASAFAELENFPKAIEYSEKALRVFTEQNQMQFRLITLPNLATQYYKNGDTIKAVNFYSEAEKLALKLGNKRSLSMTYNNLGDIYLEKQPLIAKDYLERALLLKKELNLESGVAIIKSNLGYIHLNKNEYKTAITYFNDAVVKVKGKQLVFVYNNLKDCYEGLGQLSRALEFSEKTRALSDSILSSENQKVFNEVLTKYETEKKEKEILELKTENLKVDFKRKQNKDLLLGALIILLGTLFFVYMRLKNAKRKRIIMEQNIIIKNKEFDQVLKNQELNAIDVILETQEKERTRIANDLHDNLGSKIATLKLYIDDFKETIGEKDKEKNALLLKISSITDDTYKEVRKIAHNKNFGSLIGKGLIPSTKVIAKQISSSNKLHIRVVNIDVKKAIENNIEIQIFRSIQELLTNSIKHAKATEVVIQFSEHGTVLNVIIEDNGVGFDVGKIGLGHGLTNIENRMERIGGSVAIDSTRGNGTTVILNIPL